MVLLCSIQTATILRQYVIHQSSYAQPGAQAGRRKSAAPLSFTLAVTSRRHADVRSVRCSDNRLERWASQ
jgi:hypothetical protein